MKILGLVALVFLTGCGEEQSTRDEKMKRIGRVWSFAGYEEVFKFHDTSNDVVCYVYWGNRAGGISCLHIPASPK